MDDLTADLIAKLALWRTPDIGPSRYRRILRMTHQPRELLSWTEEQRQQAGWSAEGILYWSKQLYTREVNLDLRWQEKEGRYLVFEEDDDYPTQLRAFRDAPPVIFLQGQRAVLQNPQIAIVGTRNPTREGVRFTQSLSGELVRQQLTVTSGLALGIDAAAHTGALQVTGCTIAVLANGLDRIYPASHVSLAEQILANNGALISEFPIGVLPRREYFPRRNRIISGLAYGVVVIEAAIKSGSLITARLAGQQGKEVFAVPGPVHQPQSRGCHQLLREGATLVESAEDIINVIYPLMQQQMGYSPTPDSHTSTPTQTCIFSIADPKKNHPTSANDAVLDLPLEMRLVLSAVQAHPTSLDQLTQATQLRTDVLLTHLMTLELHDHILTVPGGYQRCV